MAKKNVFNYELDGYEWDDVPSILMYTREVGVRARVKSLAPDL